MNPQIIELLNTISAAGGGHGDGINWFVISSMVLNFFLLFGFLGAKIMPALGTALKERRSDMEQQINEAKAKQAEAEAQLAEYKDKLAHLEEEVERVVKSYESEAKAESERLKAETEKAIERLARESDFTIKQEIRKAEKAIREASVTATLQKAETIIRERITDADRRRLADQYIAHLEQGTSRPN